MTPLSEHVSHDSMAPAAWPLAEPEPGPAVARDEAAGPARAATLPATLSAVGHYSDLADAPIQKEDPSPGWRPLDAEDVVSVEDYDGREVLSAEGMKADDHSVKWTECFDDGQGQVLEIARSGRNLYGADARAEGVVPDPADPFGTADVSALNWERVAAVGGAGTAPDGWGCELGAPRQPLPVRAPETHPVTGEKHLTPLPIQPAQIAFAQGCVNELRGPYEQAHQSWEAMSEHVIQFNTAGDNEDFHEGGLNWIPTRNPSAAQRGQNMEELAGQQTVNDGKSKVKDVMAMGAKETAALRSDLPPEKQALLEKKAGAPAAAVTTVQVRGAQILGLMRDAGTAKGSLATARRDLELSDLEDEQDGWKDKLAVLQAKQKSLDGALKGAFTAIDIGLAFASAPEAIEKMSYSVLKAFFTQVESAHHEKEIKASSENITRIAGEMKALSRGVRTARVEEAAAGLTSLADRIALAKKELVVALRAADDAHETFAKEVGALVGGEKGQGARSAIEALPKVTLVAQTCEAVVGAITIPAFSRNAGLGLLACVRPAESFVQRCAQLKGYKESFAAKAEVWKAAQVRLEAVAQSYGLGN